MFDKAALKDYAKVNAFLIDFRRTPLPEWTDDVHQHYDKIMTYIVDLEHRRCDEAAPGKIAFADTAMHHHLRLVGGAIDDPGETLLVGTAAAIALRVNILRMPAKLPARFANKGGMLQHGVPLRALRAIKNALLARSAVAVDHHPLFFTAPFGVI